MSRNWNRQIQVVFDTRSISSDDFDILFNYDFNTDEEPNEIEVDVKNLANDTINTYITKDKQLIINAGYLGDVGNICKGFIADTSTTWGGTDKDTTIIGFDASEEYLRKFISKAYAPGITALEIINDLVNETGLTLGEMTLTNNIQYPRGRSVTGKLRDILKEIVVNDCGTNLQIRSGTIIIRDIGQGLETGFVLSAETGLIGSPEPVTTTGAGEENADKKADYKVRCQLNHRIGPMTRLQINSKYLTATVVVLSGSHKGSLKGDFITEMEVKLI